LDRTSILIIFEHNSSWIIFLLRSHKLTSGINSNIVCVRTYIDTVIATTAAETKVPLAIDMSVLRISLGGAPQFVLVYPTIGPLGTAREPPASPHKWKDTLLTLSWSFYYSAPAVTGLLRAVRGAQQAAGARVTLHLPRAAWTTRVLASWTRAGTQAIETLAADVGTIGMDSHRAPGLSQASCGALVVHNS